jgi:hypothetical protein
MSRRYSSTTAAPDHHTRRTAPLRRIPGRPPSLGISPHTMRHSFATHLPQRRRRPPRDSGAPRAFLAIPLHQKYTSERLAVDRHYYRKRIRGPDESAVGSRPSAVEGAARNDSYCRPPTADYRLSQRDRAIVHHGFVGAAIRVLRGGGGADIGPAVLFRQITASRGDVIRYFGRSSEVVLNRRVKFRATAGCSKLHVRRASAIGRSAERGGREPAGVVRHDCRGHHERFTDNAGFEGGTFSCKAMPLRYFFFATTASVMTTSATGRKRRSRARASC